MFNSCSEPLSILLFPLKSVIDGLYHSQTRVFVGRRLGVFSLFHRPRALILDGVQTLLLNLVFHIVEHVLLAEFCFLRDDGFALLDLDLVEGIVIIRRWMLRLSLLFLVRAQNLIFMWIGYVSINIILIQKKMLFILRDEKVSNCGAWWFWTTLSFAFKTATTGPRSWRNNVALGLLVARFGFLYAHVVDHFWNLYFQTIGGILRYLWLMWWMWTF